MLRLRTTIGLSIIALIVGVGGTAWLTSETGDWVGPTGHAVTHIDKVRAVLRRRPRTAHAVAERPMAQRPPSSTPAAPASATLPPLTPVDMPPLAASPWKREPMASGRVVLNLSVDGGGQVMQAAVAQSSGNAGLDDRAVRTVLRWRFAVPAGHADGLRGELVMRFDDSAASL